MHIKLWGNAKKQTNKQTQCIASKQGGKKRNIKISFIEKHSRKDRDENKQFTCKFNFIETSLHVSVILININGLTLHLRDKNWQALFKIKKKKKFIYLVTDIPNSQVTER